MIYWDIFWLHIVKKMYEATNITRGTGFFFLEIDGNWCRRPTLCEKVVGITDQLLTTDLRMCRIAKWGWHQSRHGNFTTHIITYLYIYIYIHIYIYIYSCNPAKSSTKLHILIDLGVLWYVVMRPKRNQNAAPWPPWCVVCFSEKSQEQLYHPEFYKRLSGREGRRPPLKSPMTGAICSGIVLHVSNDKLIMATSRADLTVNEGCEPGFTYGVC